MDGSEELERARYGFSDNGTRGNEAGNGFARNGWKPGVHSDTNNRSSNDGDSNRYNFDKDSFQQHYHVDTKKSATTINKYAINAPIITRDATTNKSVTEALPPTFPITLDPSYPPNDFAHIQGGRGQGRKWFPNVVIPPFRVGSYSPGSIPPLLPPPRPSRRGSSNNSWMNSYASLLCVSPPRPSSILPPPPPSLLSSPDSPIIPSSVCRVSSPYLPFYHQSSPSPPFLRDRYKMSLCNFFYKGRCKNGPSCRFAHGTAELRGPLPTKKTNKKQKEKSVENGNLVVHDKNKNDTVLINVSNNQAAMPKAAGSAKCHVSNNTITSTAVGSGDTLITVTVSSPISTACRSNSVTEREENEEVIRRCTVQNRNINLENNVSKIDNKNELDMNIDSAAIDRSMGDFLIRLSPPVHNLVDVYEGEYSSSAHTTNGDANNIGPGRNISNTPDNIDNPLNSDWFVTSTAIPPRYSVPATSFERPSASRPPSSPLPYPLSPPSAFSSNAPHSFTPTAFPSRSPGSPHFLPDSSIPTTSYHAPLSGTPNCLIENINSSSLRNVQEVVSYLVSLVDAAPELSSSILSDLSSSILSDLSAFISSGTLASCLDTEGGDGTSSLEKNRISEHEQQSVTRLLLLAALALLLNNDSASSSTSNHSSSSSVISNNTADTSSVDVHSNRIVKVRSFNKTNVAATNSEKDIGNKKNVVNTANISNIPTIITTPTDTTNTTTTKNTVTKSNSLVARYLQLPIAATPTYTSFMAEQLLTPPLSSHLLDTLSPLHGVENYYKSTNRFEERSIAISYTAPDAVPSPSPTHFASPSLSYKRSIADSNSNDDEFNADDGQFLQEGEEFLKHATNDYGSATNHISLSSDVYNGSSMKPSFLYNPSPNTKNNTPEIMESLFHISESSVRPAPQPRFSPHFRSEELEPKQNYDQTNNFKYCNDRCSTYCYYTSSHNTSSPNSNYGYPRHYNHNYGTSAVRRPSKRSSFLQAYTSSFTAGNDNPRSGRTRV